MAVAAPMDAAKVYELLKKGAALSTTDAAKLDKKADYAQARIQLLSFYATGRRVWSWRR